MTNRLIKADGLETMKTLEDNSIDHVVCDLPFYGVVDVDWDNQWKTEEEYIEWCRSLIIEYKRIIKPNGNIMLFTGRQYNRKIATILDEHFNEKRIIIWARKRNFNSTRGKALASGYEPICYYCNGNDGIYNNIKLLVDSKRKEYTEGFLKDGITLSDVWSDISALPHNSKERLPHKTQKPLKLIERIVLLISNEGDVILDNCCGSGTLGEACVLNNRNFIMIDKYEENYNIAKDRMYKYKENNNIKFE